MHSAKLRLWTPNKQGENVKHSSFVTRGRLDSRKLLLCSVSSHILVEHHVLRGGMISLSAPAVLMGPRVFNAVRSCLPRSEVRFEVFPLKTWTSLRVVGSLKF